MTNPDKKEESFLGIYHKLFMCCSNCEKTGCKLVVDGFCYVDLDDNGICFDCYNHLKDDKKSKKFRVEWLDNPRHPEKNIYE